MDKEDQAVEDHLIVMDLLELKVVTDLVDKVI